MTMRTARNLARCFTIRRAWNLLLLFVSYALSEWTRRPVVLGRPYTLTIEPTNRCNLSCPECPSGNGTLVRPLGSMALDDFVRLVDAVAQHAFYLQLFFQGEPFINKSLLDMVAHARSRRMYVAISTNAHFITERVAAELLDRGVDRIIVSLDGTSEESYRAYRVGGSLAKVRDALEHLRDARVRANGHARSELVLQFLVSRQNEHEIPQARSMAGAVGAQLALKTMQVYSMESAERFLPTDERYRRYRIADGALIPKSAMKNRCVRLWERSVVTWDGVVVPCCFDKNAEHPLGNVRSATFNEIWKSKKYMDFRREILENRRGIPMCTNCTEGLKVYR
jgi:radical SAM protein with 4Fe4S-binding SPASM domain